MLIGARYRLERLVAEGGMGVVWAAEDVETAQRCAVKLMKDAGNPQLRERFLHEGRMSLKMSHGNVVRILDVLEPADGSPAIIMELLDGESLRAVLERHHSLALAELAEVMVPVVSAVGSAHALGIVHRDLKPENVFLVGAPSRTVKVLDFGIAKLTPLDGDARRSTGNTTGVVWGTPRYMAPEQAAGAKVDHRADIWSLGIVLYECLSGVCPTRGDDVLHVLTNVALKPFEPLSQIVPHVPEEVSQLVARMLSRKPAERPTLHEVLEVLEPLANTSEERFGDPVPAPDPFAATVAVVPLRRRRTLRRIGLASVPVVVAIGVVVALSVGSSRAPSQPRAVVTSPLDPPDSKLACPILRASGVEEPSGWLGAAAAAVACERARVLLGGRKERTLVPAELLGLQGEPSDSFPIDPYGRSGAVEESLAEARQRSQAYLDGEVIWSSPGFTASSSTRANVSSAAIFKVKLSLRGANGTEIRSAEGAGQGLYEAVRSAMTPLVGDGLIPKATKLEPEIAAWSRTDSVDDALGLIDLTFAFAQNAGGLVEECRSFQKISPRLHELGAEGQWLCAYTLGQQLPDVKLDVSDPSVSAVATRIRINHVIHRSSGPNDAKWLRSKLELEPTSRGRALLAVTASCLLHDEPIVARDLALAAVKSEPSSSDGGWCAPWWQLKGLERGREGPWRAMRAWLPWDSHVWLWPSEFQPDKMQEALEGIHRARVLSRFDSDVARRAAAGFLRSGDLSLALNVASDLVAGGAPLHRVEKTLLLVRIDTSEAKFRQALDRAREAEISSDDHGWVRAQRFELAWSALELAVLLGRPREIADAIVERFLGPEPPLVDHHVYSSPMRIPAVCVHASHPDRCFERFRSLEPQFHGLITQKVKDFAAGAERFSKGDFAGAANKWRPLGAMVDELPDEMVETFQRAGAADLGEQIDRETMKRAWRFNGATLGHVRAARRAFQQGDRARARELAEQVIKAWGNADEEPPTLAEMRSLVEQIRKR